MRAAGAKTRSYSLHSRQSAATTASASTWPITWAPRWAALLVSTLLIPLLGVSGIAWLAGGSNLLSAVILLILGSRRADLSPSPRPTHGS